MNWTEGALARHSRGKGWKEDAARQKKHFARARTGLRHTSAKESPVSISFVPFKARGSQQANQKAHTSSLEPGSLRRRHTHAPQTPRGHPVSNSPHAPTTQHFCSQTRKAVIQKLSLGTYNEDHNGQGMTQPDRYEADELETKRRRLLQKGDWAGVNIQKTLPIRFPQRGNSNQRWGLDIKEQRQSGSRRHFFSAEGPAESSYRTQLMGEEFGARQPLNKEIRIRIGSQDIRLGPSTPSVGIKSKKRKPRSSSSCRSNNNQSSPHFPPHSSQHRSQVPYSNSSPYFSRHVSYKSQVGDAMANMRCRKPVQDYAHTNRARTLDNGAAGSPSPPVQKNEETFIRRLVPGQRQLYIESSPAFVHQPAPQRAGQLRLLDKSRSPDTENAGSTVARVGWKPSSSIPQAVARDNERWQSFVAPSLDYTEYTQRGGAQIKAQMEPSISPGVSNQQHRHEPVYGPRFDYSPINSSSESGGLVAAVSDELVSSLHESPQASIRPVSCIELSSDESSVYTDSDDDDALRLLLPSSLDRESTHSHPIVTDVPAPKRHDHKDIDVEGSTTSESIGDYTGASLASPVTTTLEEPIHVKKLKSADYTSEGNIQDPSFGNAGIEHLDPHTVLSGVPKSHEKHFTEEENAAWMTFIFGDDSDEVVDVAFDSAKREEAKTLRPSSSPESCQETLSTPLHDFGTVTTCGTMTSDAAECTMTTSASNIPTTSSSTASFPPARLGWYSHLLVSKDSGYRMPASRDSLRNFSASPGALSALVALTETDSMVVQPAESEMNDQHASKLKFSQPKQFVGRLVSTSKPVLAPIVQLSVKDRPGRKRRLKRKSSDGRANIRALPDYDGDPIDGSDC